MNGYTYTQNRDLSWLDFNRRVLSLAADETIPLLERLRFISIFSANLEDFLSVRAEKLRTLPPDTVDRNSGMTTEEIRARINAAVMELTARKDELYHSITAQLPPAGFPEEALRYPPYTARFPEDMDERRSIIGQILERDRLLFYPYDSMEPFLRLLAEASESPEVMSVKITVYRLAPPPQSEIAHLLCRAAKNGKDVTVLVELRARFDEENNRVWADMFRKAGCRVIYGMEDFKCHSKICLITLRNGRHITQIGTGNYNEKTALQYTDLSLMTADEQIGLDSEAFFRNVSAGKNAGGYKKLFVSPHGIKAMVLDKINGEMEKGSDGAICLKVNALSERDIMDKLAEASMAGVEIHLIVRGICCIRPGIPAVTENIHLRSIVGRYLEHARVYCFGRGDQAEYTIASADMMTRNLSRRIEIACPIQDKRLQRILKTILDTQLHEREPQTSFMIQKIR